MFIECGLFPLISAAIKILNKFCPTLFISNSQKINAHTNTSPIEVSSTKQINLYKVLAFAAITITISLWCQILRSEAKSLWIILDSVLWAMMYTGHLSPVLEHLKQRDELAMLYNSFLDFELRHQGNHIIYNTSI